MLQQLLSQIAPRRFFETVLGQPLPTENNRGDVRLNCCFHKDRLGREDDTESLSVNVTKDGTGMFRCFGCDVSGNLISFYKEYRKVHGINIKGARVQGDTDLRTIARELIQLFELDSDTFERSIIDDEKLTKYQHDLYHEKDGKKLLNFIQDARCITEKVIRDYKLGFSEHGRLAIPIFDIDDEIVNVRYWLPEYARDSKQDKSNKIFGIPGANRPKLYPYKQIRNNDIIICEGEMDALVLIGLGFNAITTTGGVEGFSKQWIPLFEGKNITLILDNDPAGQAGMDSLLLTLYPVAKSVRQLALGEAGQDVTDWVKACGKDAGQVLRETLRNTPLFYIQDEQDKKYDLVNIHSAANAERINKNIALTALVAGKEEQIYAVPKQVQVTCTSSKPKNCPGCPRLMYDRDTRETEIEPDNPAILDILSSRGALETVLKKIMNINCKTCQFEAHDYQNVEVLHLIPSTDRNNTESYEYTNRVAFKVGNEDRIRMNDKYKFFGKTVLDPDNRVTHLFHKYEVQDKLSKNLKSDDLVTIDGVEAKVSHHLAKFQVGKDQEVGEKLSEIYEDLEQHVTRIIQRRDVLQAYDLVWHSPLSFVFGSRVHDRGWMSCLVIGDTQCGKSETLYTLKDHYRLGEVYSGENITRAGIIGAYTEIPGRRGTQFRIGIAPLNDGGLIGIDEAGGMSEEQFDELTMLRSTGEAISTKYGQHNRFPARVRMILASNPRKGKPMHYYTHGCQAVKELIGGDADIARFDIFVAVGSNEVKLSDINTNVPITTTQVYTSDLCNLLVQWVWTRKPSDYVFTEDAQQMVFDVANEMSQQYDQSIPLVTHGSHRWTIARVSAAIAGRLYSSPDGSKVLVKTDHVEAAAAFLYQTYNKPLMGYGAYSARKRMEETVKDDAAVLELCNLMPYNLFDAITVGLSRFTVKELDTDTNLGDHTIKDYVAKLRALRAIKHSGGYYYCTEGFKRLLDQSGFKHEDADEFLDNFLHGESDTGQQGSDVNI